MPVIELKTPACLPLVDVPPAVRAPFESLAAVSDGRSLSNFNNPHIHTYYRLVVIYPLHILCLRYFLLALAHLNRMLDCMSTFYGLKFATPPGAKRGHFLYSREIMTNRVKHSNIGGKLLLDTENLELFKHPQSLAVSETPVSVCECWFGGNLPWSDVH